MTNKLKVAIIGAGNIGTAISTNLAKANRSFIIADRRIEKSKGIAQKFEGLVQALEISAAIREADIIVLAVWFDAIKELLKANASIIAGKIIIDPSNPIAPDEKGGFRKIIGEKDSAGEIISSLLPRDAKLAKALGTLGVASLENAAFKKPANVLFYAIDDSSIKADIELLIHDIGFEPVLVGGIDQSIRIEVFGDLHEFGALGKPVTLSEASGKLDLTFLEKQS